MLVGRGVDLIDVRQPEVYAERAVALAVDDAARTQLGRSGRELFEREFTWDAIADRLVNATTEKSIDGRFE